MSKVLVIGYGNTLRGDDAAGVKAAELISKHHPEIICVVVHQLVPELSEQIAECDTVFFIDAQQGITQPNVRLIKPSMEADQPHTHFISPESLLSLSQQLYKRTSPVFRRLSLNSAKNCLHKQIKQCANVLPW